MDNLRDILKQAEELKGQARTLLLDILRNRIKQLTPSPVAKKPLVIFRKQGTESVNRPQYAKWAAQLTAGKPIRLLTTHERVICFIPSSVFPDNGDMPIGTLMITYASEMYQGVVELDFSKKPNPFYLNMKGFPMHIGTLICQIIYAMFPHLNPLTEEDIRTLQASKTRRGAKSTLRLTAPKRKHEKVQKPDSKPIETQDNAHRSTQQRETPSNASETGSKPPRTRKTRKPCQA